MKKLKDLLSCIRHNLLEIFLIIVLVTLASSSFIILAIPFFVPQSDPQPIGFEPKSGQTFVKEVRHRIPIGYETDYGAPEYDSEGNVVRYGDKPVYDDQHYALILQPVASTLSPLPEGAVYVSISIIENQEGRKYEWVIPHGPGFDPAIFHSKDGFTVIESYFYVATQAQYEGLSSNFSSISEDIFDTENAWCATADLPCE